MNKLMSIEEVCSKDEIIDKFGLRADDVVKNLEVACIQTATKFIKRIPIKFLGKVKFFDRSNVDILRDDGEGGDGGLVCTPIETTRTWHMPLGEYQLAAIHDGSGGLLIKRTDCKGLEGYTQKKRKEGLKAEHKIITSITKAKKTEWNKL